MNSALKALAVSALLAVAQGARATPSTTFWTPATTYTQPALVPHLTYDTYFAEQGALQIDTGLELGLFSLPYLQAEAGVDFFYPGDTKKYVQLNAKLTLPEGALASWAPGLSAGIANAGFEKDVSDYHLLHATLGKTTPLGILGVGGYYGAGSKALWTGSDGDVNRAGFMASWVSPDVTVNLPGLQKIIFLADVATGKNWMGAAGGGIGLYFTPAIDVLTGPVFFLDQDYYKGATGTDWMWTVQLDVDVELLAKK
ncbi:hypothetical protein [Anaeromyxobacter sp. PSR-1]|uniref:hypothetical protein n=1 Tax=unclassified Anaeromyxobacter TaxID=2620896 RepID=UPI0005DE379D|nr:hypothetical protein [Anaeromyxobacter sp. PSR-1]GAO04050.1 hypothetical protein PSR1_02938 [Anaeromyxobacter sp. PSR-1]